MIPVAVVAMLATACSSEDDFAVEKGLGTAEFAFGVSGSVTDVVTRATQGTLDDALLPKQADFEAKQRKIKLKYNSEFAV